jgi:glycosyltransferase involved in cell wall biosynthesis
MLDALARHFRLPLEQAVIFNGRSVASSKAVARALQSITVGRIWDEGKDIGLLREVTSPIPMLVAGESERYGSGPAESEWGDIKFLGALSQRQVLDIFRRSAIYICTSVYEPFGLAPLEAALCGCAVLARDLPSLKEVWGDHALYFRDAPSLSQLLHQLHDDSHLLRERQRQSAARASFFSAERMAHAYLALYRRLCAQPTAASDAA